MESDNKNNNILLDTKEEAIDNSSDIIICNSDDLDNGWENVYVTGRIPPPRHAHASCVVGDSMYMYGGYGAKGTHLDDFFRFDLKSNKWIRILKNKKPSTPSPVNNNNTTTTPDPNIITARHSHSMVAYGESIYLFGGIGMKSDNENVYNELFEYNTVTNEWKLIVNNNSVNEHGTSSFVPEKRWGHSAVIWKDSMLIYGGMGQSISFYPTILEFNFITKKWSRLNFKNIISSSQVPRGRQFQTVSIINDKLYILGGYDGAVCPTDMYQFDLINNYWSIVHGPHKIVRCGSSVTFNNNIYLFGGRNKNVSNSLHQFNPSTNSWIEIKLSNKPSPRQYSTSVIYNNKLYIFGGQSDHNENDIFSYSFYKNKKKSIYDSLFENRESFSDTKFKVEDKIIYANKFILVSRNEKMRALITNGMQESKMDIIEINNCSYNVFLTIIQYLYTGNLIFNDLNILELLLISDQYMIDEIKYHCSNYISKLHLTTPISEIYHLIIDQTLSKK